jgi:DNA-binding XRE family transcriptional regulator
MSNPITTLIDKAGSAKAVADALQLTSTAVLKWEKRGKLPRTEWTGETKYAEKLELAFGISRHVLAPGAYGKQRPN